VERLKSRVSGFALIASDCSAIVASPLPFLAPMRPCPGRGKTKGPAFTGRSRAPFDVEVLPDERAKTIAFLGRAVRFFRRYGVRVERVLTDN
jgi:hypothetical protein